jgi:Pentapeptide repeats (8 copies)
MDERILKLMEPMEKQPGLRREELSRLREQIAANWPPDYLEFLRWSNGAHGDMLPSLPLLAERADPTRVVLFSTDEVLKFASDPAEEYAHHWQSLSPNYLVVGWTSHYLALLRIRGPQPISKPYAIVDFLPDTQASPMYELGSFADLVERLSTTYLWLLRADLSGAELHNACLLGAQLTDAVLVGADLTGADLRGACVIGADFTNAKLANVRLTGALYEPHTRWPEGFRPQQHGAQLTWDEEKYGGRWPEAYERFYRSLGRT